MNRDTGEIKDREALEELLEVGLERDKDWFGIDSLPDKNCEACEGEGWVGYFPNAKVIPCPCVFSSHGNWCAAVVKQRDLSKSSKDRGKDLIWEKRKEGR